MILFKFCLVPNKWNLMYHSIQMKCVYAMPSMLVRKHTSQTNRHNGFIDPEHILLQPKKHSASSAQHTNNSESRQSNYHRW